MKHRELPEIVRGGKTFIVDVAFSELVEKGQPEHYLDIRDMIDKGDHYKFDHENPPEQLKEIFKYKKDWIDITIPHMCKMDPEGVAIKYGLKVHQLPEKDSQLKCSPQLITERLEHCKLPIINICAEQYFVDWRLKELRLTTNFSKRIDLDSLDIVGDYDKYAFFYNVKTKNRVEIPMDITELPDDKNLVMVFLPHECWLDPVSVAREERDIDLLSYIDRYPLQFNLTARTYPISQSWLPYLIKENLKDAAALKQTPEPIKQTIKSKRKKGKGL